MDKNTKLTLAELMRRKGANIGGKENKADKKFIHSIA